MNEKDPAHPDVDKDTTQEKRHGQKRTLCERMEGIVVSYMRRFCDWTRTTKQRVWSSGAVLYDECTHHPAELIPVMEIRKGNDNNRAFSIASFDARMLFDRKNVAGEIVDKDMVKKIHCAGEAAVKRAEEIKAVEKAKAD